MNPDLASLPMYETPSAIGFRHAPAVRALERVNNTLLGRLVVGPFVMILGFPGSEALLFARDDRCHAGAWIRHPLACAGVLAFVLPGASLSRIRFVGEHRWAERSEERTAIMETAGPFALLFLNDNLHVPHHLRPTIPWCRPPVHAAGPARRRRSA